MLHSSYALPVRVGRRNPNRVRNEFAMPKSQTSHLQHRDKLAESPPISALVARPVGKKDIQQQAKARAAFQAEWDRLRHRKCWEEDPNLVREWDDVAAEARITGQ